MTTSSSNWFVVYPHKDKKVIKQEYEKLNLKEFTVSVIIINDKLSEKEKNEYIEFVNKNIKYNGHISTSSANTLLVVIENMGGVDSDDLYILKKGKIARKKARF